MTTESKLSALGPLAKLIAYGAVWLACVLVIFMTQASSSDYRQLWWMTLPVAIVQAASAVAYHARRDRRRGDEIWLIAAMAALAFLELSLRVWW